VRRGEFLCLEGSHSSISDIGEMMAHALGVNGASKVFILSRRNDSLEKVASNAVGFFVTTNSYIYC
jgi:NADP-dependent 3-hydroxy acid dehydrogenase YdfG